MANNAKTVENTLVGPKTGQTKNISFEKARNFSVLDEGDCQTAWLFAYWGPFGRQRRAWPHGADPPHFHMHIGKIGQFFQNKGFPSNQRWIMCRWSPQYRWAPPEHPRDTGHTFSASCLRLPIRLPSFKWFVLFRLTQFTLTLSNSPFVCSCCS